MFLINQIFTHPLRFFSCYHIHIITQLSSLGSIFKEGLEAPKSYSHPSIFSPLPLVEDWEGVSRAWGLGRRALTTPRLPQVLLTPDPLSAPPALGKKKRNFLACWDLPSSPLCKDKFKVVGGQQVLTSAQGTRAQRWAGPAEVTDQPEAELPPFPRPPPPGGQRPGWSQHLTLG